MTPYYTDQQAQHMRREYESGMTLLEISLKWFCSEATVRNYIIKAGGSFRPYRADKQKMAKLYQSGLSGVAVARIMGCCKETVYAALKETGVTARRTNHE